MTPSIGAPGHGPLHQSLAAQLELPQVRVEIERIELRLTARLEQCGEPLDVVGEDLLGDLPTAGELGPVPGVGGRGDDRRVHSRGVMPASSIGERPVRRVKAVSMTERPSGSTASRGA